MPVVTSAVLSIEIKAGNPLLDVGMRIKTASWDFSGQVTFYNTPHTVRGSPSPAAPRTHPWSKIQPGGRLESGCHPVGG